MNEIKHIDLRLAWLAGVIDGEGTVCLGYVRSGARSGKKISVLGRFEVAIGNTDEAMLNEVMRISDVLGIGYAYVHDRVRRRNDKPCNRVVFMSKKRVREILTVTYPYLVTKRERAEIMLRAIQHRDRSQISYGSRLGTWRGGGYTPVLEDNKFVGYVAEMVRLNRRGRNDGVVEPTPDQFAYGVTRQGSMLDAVVGGQGEHNIPTGQPEPTSSGVL